MNGKKWLCIFLLLVSISTFSFAQNQERSPHLFGVYLKDTIPLSMTRKYTKDEFGGGLSYTYLSPFSIKMFDVGFSGRIEFLTSVINMPDIKNWNTLDFAAGSCFNWQINELFCFSPSLEAGVMIDTLHSEKVANGTYVTPFLQIGAGCSFNLKALETDGLSVELTPLYTMGFQSTGIESFINFRLGVQYRFGGKNYQIHEERPEPETVYVEVIKEVVQEVRVEEPVEIEEEEIDPVPYREDGSVDVEIPSITFIMNGTDFRKDIEVDEKLDEIARILNDELYSRFRIVITGFINPDEELWDYTEKGLAVERAETVMKELILRGVAEERFTVQYGKGKTDDRIYNRRVELKLYK